MKSPSIQVNKDADDKDKKFSPKITCPALESTNKQDVSIGLQRQVPRGGAHPNGVGSELTNFFFARISFFCYSWFRLQLIAIHCNRRGCEQNTPHTVIFSCTFTHVFTPHMWLKVSHDVSCKKERSSTCHHVSDLALSLHPLTSSSLSSVSTFCPFSSSPLSWSSSSMWSKSPSTKSTAHPQNEEYCPVAIHNPLTFWLKCQLSVQEFVVIVEAKDNTSVGTCLLVARERASEECLAAWRQQRTRNLHLSPRTWRLRR